MIKINPSDLEIAQLRNLKFSVNVQGKQEHGWSAVYNNLGLKEAFRKLDTIKNDYYDKGVFLQSNTGSLKYWSTTSSDIFNSVVLLV